MGYITLNACRITYTTLYSVWSAVCSEVLLRTVGVELTTELIMEMPWRKHPTISCRVPFNGLRTSGKSSSQTASLISPNGKCNYRKQSFFLSLLRPIDVQSSPPLFRVTWKFYYYILSVESSHFSLFWISLLFMFFPCVSLSICHLCLAFNKVKF